MKVITIACLAAAVIFTSANLDRIGQARLAAPANTDSSTYDVRTFGAKGDGVTLDTNAINKALDTASSKGGGAIYFPAGTYLSVSIHLKNNITLYLDQGATILAADTIPGKVTYDLPEPNEWDMYQDFGHSH